MRILAVEDEAKVAQALKGGLASEGYDPVVAHTGEDGFYLASAQVFDLIVLDIMLPGRSGREVLSTLRKRGITIVRQVAAPCMVIDPHGSPPHRTGGPDGSPRPAVTDALTPIEPNPFVFPFLLSDPGPNAVPISGRPTAGPLHWLVRQHVLEGTSRTDH